MKLYQLLNELGQSYVYTGPSSSLHSEAHYTHRGGSNTDHLRDIIATKQAIINEKQAQMEQIIRNNNLNQQRSDSMHAVNQNNDAISMLHSSDKEMQIQGARKILNAALTRNDEATAQEANQVLSSVMQVASIPATPKAKVNIIKNNLGISAVAAALLLFGGLAMIRRKNAKNRWSNEPNRVRISEEVISLYREGYLSRDNALLALKVLKS